MKHLIIILFSLFIIISCSEKAPVETTVNDGDVVFSFNKSEIPESVYLIKIILSRDNFDSITEELNPKNNSNAEVYFQEVAVGEWNLKVNAYSVDNNLLYTGEAIVSVKANIVTPVFLQLKYVNGSKTGSVYIFVSWESQINMGWFDHPSNPLIEDLDSFGDCNGVGSPAVIHDQSGFKMWFTGLTGSGSYIYSAVSRDGLNWNRVDSLPVISPGNIGMWDDRNVTAGPVIKKDGQYIMYYTGRSTAERESSPWHIGMATSIDGVYWEKRPDPVLSGSVGAWDLKIAVSDIKIIDGIYYMYYTGKTGLYDHQIGMATSIDGISWTKHENNPILSPQIWEGEGYYWPSIVKKDNQYIMVYMNSIARISGFGFAYSKDGQSWVKASDNPFITADDTNNKWNRILYPNFLVIDNEMRIYYTGLNATNNWLICVMRKFIN